MLGVEFAVVSGMVNPLGLGEACDMKSELDLFIKKH
jgi:hypothetical protein